MASRPKSTIFLASFLALAAVPATAADRWEPAGSGAVVILPTPSTANGIESGSLYCAEQKWGFLLRIVPNALTDGTHAAKITVNSVLTEVDSTVEGQVVDIKVPHRILDPLKAGNRLAIEVGPVETGVAAIFNLRGSKIAIDAVAPKCSQVDMSAFEQVALSETDPEIEQAKTVVADEMKVFRQSTGKDPVVAAKSMTLPEGKKLLFASVCGSTNFYGPSGCNLTGHVSEGAAGPWREVYNTEGMLLYTDPKASNGGWPNLVTLPIMNGVEPTHWVWSGELYELRDVIIAGDEQTQEEGDTSE